jgi:hypothetical protein
VPDWSLSLLSTLVGAGVALLTIVSQQRSSRNAENRARRQRLATRYLSQLQDAAESLWFRMENLRDRAGAEWMDRHNPGYREASTVYAAGRYLAIYRILTLEGVWADLIELDAELVTALKQHRLSEKTLGLFHYDQIALAELVLEVGTSEFRTSTYLEFHARYASDAFPPKWRQRIWKKLDELSAAQLTDSLNALRAVAQRLERDTNIPTLIPATPEPGEVTARSSSQSRATDM